DSGATDTGATDTGAANSGATAVGNDDVAKLRARLRPAGLAEELVAEGTITTRPGPLDVRLALEVHGRALSWKPLQPYLSGLGIAAVLEGGEVEGSLRGAVRVAAGVTAIEAQLTNVRFAQGTEELASLAAITLDGMQLSERGLHVSALDVDRPSLWLSRRADGNVSLLGLAFDPALQAMATRQPPAPP